MNYENEIWKPIKSITLKTGQVHYFEGYEVSNYGRVRTYKQKYGKVSKANIEAGLNRPLLPYPTMVYGRPDQKGYTQYCLSDINKVRKNFRAHILVMQVFAGLPKEYEVVCHNDDVKTNNHISNLRYDSQLENIRDIARNNGRYHKASPEKKITISQ
jgi:hypothetical protein